MDGRKGDRERVKKEAQGQLRSQSHVCQARVNSYLSRHSARQFLFLLQVYGGCLCLPRDAPVGSGVILAQSILLRTWHLPFLPIPQGQCSWARSAVDTPPHNILPAPNTQPHLSSHQILTEGQTTLKQTPSLPFPSWRSQGTISPRSHSKPPSLGEEEQPRKPGSLSLRPLPGRLVLPPPFLWW